MKLWLPLNPQISTQLPTPVVSLPNNTLTPSSFCPTPAPVTTSGAQPAAHNAHNNRSIMLRNPFLYLIFAFLTFPSAVQAEPLTWWRWTGDQQVLQATLDCALPRWRAATCLPIDVSYYPSHWVRQWSAQKFTDSGFEGHVEHSWGSWSTAQTAVLEDMSTAGTCVTFMHSLSHILRKSNSHIGEMGGISYAAIRLEPTINGPASHITDADIDAVCAVQNCQCHVAEIE